MYIITLADGTKLEDLSRNGSNFVSKTKIEESVFENNLSTVTITNDDDDKYSEVIEDAVLDSFQKIYSFYFFCIREKTEQEKKAEQLNKTLNGAVNDITDIQEALVYIYEQIIEG